MRAIAGFLAVLLASVSVPLETAQNGPDWQASDGPFDGSVHDIAVCCSGALFAITSRGLHRSLDDGLRWSACGDVQGTFVRMLADGRLLVGTSPTGELSYLDESCQPLGKVALPPEFNSPRSIHAIAVSSTGRLVASRLAIGLFLSDDNGLTWRRASVPSAPKNSPWVLSIVAMPSGRLVGSTSGNVIQSTDNGETWITTSSTVVPHALATDSGGALLGANGDGVWRSLDEGASWQQVGLKGSHVWTMLSTNSSAAPAGGRWFAAVSPQPDVDNVVFRSANRGATWAPTGSELKGRVHRLALTSRGALIAGTSSGFFRSADEGGTWTFQGVARASLRTLAAGPPGVILGGRPGAWRSSDGGATWQPIRVYLDEGHAKAGLDEPIAFAFVRGDRLLAAVQNGVAVSMDRGTTWQRSGLSQHTFALLELADGSIMAATHGGAFRSTDGGMKWIEQSIGLTEFSVRGLAALDSGELIAATLHHIFMSTDNGRSWQKTTGLPRLASPAVLSSGRGTIGVAGTDRGIYELDPASRSWKLAVATKSPVLSLAWDADRRLWAGTDSHGISNIRIRGGERLESSAGLAGEQVLALAIDSQRSIVAATSRGTFRAALR